MKLTRCYIENFGTLHRFDISMESGVNVIKAPNGFGKTTFAAFIRAMLYGFPRANKTYLDKDPRRKYSPWQGGRFGGSIEFELEGKAYRAERFFGEKPAQDSFNLYELPEMRPCKRFSENLGVEIFGLDADSFERSAFMSRLNETGALSTDSIQAKLSDLVEDTGDVNNYEKAVANLKKSRAALLPYRGSGGEVNRASDKISSLQAELSHCVSARDRLPSLYEEIESLEARIGETNAEMERLRRELMSASEQAAAEALLHQREGLVRRCEELRAELKELTEAYPAGLPSSGEISRICNVENRLSEIRESRGKKAAELLKLKDEKEEKQQPQKIKMSRAHMAFLLLGALLAVAAAVLFILKKPALGGVILSVGLLSAAAGLYFHYSRLAELAEAASEKAEDDVEALLREYERLSQDSELAIKECEAEIDEFFDSYELTGISPDRSGLMHLRDDVLRFEELGKRSASAEKELSEFNALHPDLKEVSSTAPSNAEALRRSFDALGRELPRLNRSLAEKRREAADIQELSRSIPDVESALEHWRRVKSSGIRKADELDKTMEFLRLARESLSAGYMHRIEDGFAHYMSCLEENEEGRMFVDTDLSVKLERSGKVRALDFFSAGFSDIVMLCMRLALMDALFKDEKPFVIMDDPFINLDDEHTKKAIELINKLGSERQVIYLVCNSSRC